MKRRKTAEALKRGDELQKLRRTVKTFSGCRVCEKMCKFISARAEPVGSPAAAVLRKQRRK